MGWGPPLLLITDAFISEAFDGGISSVVLCANHTGSACGGGVPKCITERVCRLIGKRTSESNGGEARADTVRRIYVWILIIRP